MDETASDKTATPKRGKTMRLVIALALLGAGGAGAILYAQNAGLVSFGGNVDPDRPKLVPRAGLRNVDYSTRDGRPLHPMQFQASYYTIREAFTSNLKDSEGFVQIGLGVSTYYDERVIKSVQLHEIAVRSAVLMTLAEQDPAALATPQGKAALKVALRDAVNEVLKSKEGFGGVDDVYFTNFVMQ